MAEQIAFSIESAILFVCRASPSPALTDLPGARSGHPTSIPVAMIGTQGKNVRPGT